LRLVLWDERSQLKAKPNEAGPVNPAVGGSCPPPVAVHAVSTATRTTVVAHEKDRRMNGGALVFIRISKVGATGSLALQKCQRTTSTDGYIESMAMSGRDRRAYRLAASVEWDPPVPLETVLSQLDPDEPHKADFRAGVVRITASEYETALAVAARRA
jgi:hypothetical protein